MRTVGIDPGPTQSALVLLEGNEVKDKGIFCNHDALQWLRDTLSQYGVCDVAIEFIQSYGMPVGSEVFKTCLWAGRFVQVAEECGATVRLYSRPKIKAYVTRQAHAKDSDVRQSLMLRYGGTKKLEALCGFKTHLWSALAVAVYHADGAKLGGWTDEGDSVQQVRAAAE